MSKTRLIDSIAPLLFSDKDLEKILTILEAGEDATLGVGQSARALMVAAFASMHERPVSYVVSGEEAALHATRTLTGWLGANRVLLYPDRAHLPFSAKATRRRSSQSASEAFNAAEALNASKAANASHESKAAKTVKTAETSAQTASTAPSQVTSEQASNPSAKTTSGLLHAPTEDLARIGQRTQALSALVAAKPVVVVCSARALLRRLPPKETAFYQAITWKCGDEVPFHTAGQELLRMGYVRTGAAEAPGEFRIQGDTIDVYPAQAMHPVRFEFFGDEIDRIRSMVAGTNQTIADLEAVEIMPAQEFALTEETKAHAEKALWDAAREDSNIAADLEAIQAGIPNEHTERYLGALYGETSMPLEYLSPSTLLVLNEPRALFDDCMRATEEISAAASNVNVSEKDLATLFTPLRSMSFEGFQRWDFSALIQANTHLDAELLTKTPQIAGSHERLVGRMRQFADENFRMAFAVPDKGARDRLQGTFLDEHIAFEEASVAEGEVGIKTKASVVGKDAAVEVKASAAGKDAAAERHAAAKPRTLERGVVTFFTDAIPSGVIVPSVKLALFSIGDLTQHHAKRNRRTRIDVTNITFPFKPGDYVVHANHGIAKFDGVVRRALDEYERDYFLLLYGGGDKLYVPLERVDYLTRYVGPDGQNPRLTRLGTADWTRAKGRARKNAKKLAFDLVDLYARRAATQGHAFSPDTPQVKEMEAAFPYELTTDQSRALTEIKADMESPRPMDRLLSGDVGFGKTELALRAAYKAVEDGFQVLLLAPTTILAQQHFETFAKRLDPFNVRVDVLSRMRTPAEQAQSLKDLGEGKVDILIGTHRLLSADVNPKSLGLVIVDEEQRFGVAHKEQLKNMREQVDVLTLSATPIPRTMQMSMSGVRDMSLIMTPPTGRLPVKVIVHEWDADVVSDAIRAELARKGQVYYVSNRVKTIDEAVEHVREAAPEARIGVAHGQMSPRQIEDVMLKFQNQEIDILIATTIIESGLDNPRTNTLIIEDAQRLGLAQLYQLKGRVGRGHVQAYAYFMFPATEPLTPEATERLSAINEHQELGSGIRIAMRDLEIRGAGSLVGAEQHGNLSSVGFDLFTQMLGQAVEEAKGTVPSTEPADVTINIAANYYFSEDYMPEIDKRVLAYRRIAGAAELFQLEDLREDLEQEFGPLEEAGKNLFVRQAIRIRAERLGVSSISYAKGKLMFEDIDVPRSAAEKLKAEGAIVFPKTHKLSVSLHLRTDTARTKDTARTRDTARIQDTARTQDAACTQDTVEYSVLQKALHILEEIGGDDEEE